MDDTGIVDNGLYRLLETKGSKLETGCRNNILVAERDESGAFVFWDTYWGGSSGDWYYALEDIRDRIEFMIDLSNAKDVSRREWYKYDEGDRAYIPKGGGSEMWIVNKNAEKSKENMACMLEEEIRALGSEIGVRQRELVGKKRELTQLR